MRQQIAAANWKMNLTYQQGEELLDAILAEDITLAAHQRAVFAVPFPYLTMAQLRLAGKKHMRLPPRTVRIKNPALIPVKCQRRC